MAKPQGFFIDPQHRVCVGFVEGTVIFGLRPDEMRAFAAALLRSADELEAGAAEIATAAIERAAGRLQ